MLQKFSRFSNSHKLRGLLTIWLLLSLYVNSIAISKNDGSTPLALVTGAPAGSYSLSNLEHINPFNGDLSVTVPLMQIGGRGRAQYTMFLPIEHKWVIDFTPSPPPQPPFFTQDPTESIYRSGSATGYYPNKRPFPLYEPGALYARQEMIRDNGDCTVPNCSPWWGGSLTRLTFALCDGTEYELRDVQTGGKPRFGFVTTVFAPSFSRGSVFSTADGSSATFVSDSPIEDPSFLGSSASTLYPSGYLMLRDGTRYQIYRGKVIWLRDANGNKLTFDYAPHPTLPETRLGNLIKVKRILSPAQ